VPVPVEITSLLTPESLQNFEHGLETFVLNRVTGAIGKVVWRSVRRAIAPNLWPDDIEVLRRRVNRLEEFLIGLEQVRESEQDDEIEAENVEDPAYNEFVSRAMESAMCSASDGKRLLLGRLAGKRAKVKTESMLDFRMRAALRLVDETTMEQLYSIVALYFVAHPPLPRSGEMGAQQIYAEFDRKYFATFQRASEADWTLEDLEYLQAIGALQRVKREEHIVDSRLAQRLAPGGPYWPIPTGGFPESRYLDLAQELDAPAHVNPEDRPPLSELALTPIGFQLALLVIESMQAPTG
jgi:hypothetical protein